MTPLYEVHSANLTAPTVANCRIPRCSAAKGTSIGIIISIFIVLNIELTDTWSINSSGIVYTLDSLVFPFNDENCLKVYFGYTFKFLNE